MTGLKRPRFHEEDRSAEPECPPGLTHLWGHRTRLKLPVSPVSEDQLVELVESQDHVVVLAALQTFMDNPELLLQGLKVLLPLARPGNSFPASSFLVYCRLFLAPPSDDDVAATMKQP